MTWHYIPLKEVALTKLQESQIKSAGENDLETQAETRMAE